MDSLWEKPEQDCGGGWVSPMARGLPLLLDFARGASPAMFSIVARVPLVLCFPCVRTSKGERERGRLIVPWPWKMPSLELKMVDMAMKLNKGPRGGHPGVDIISVGIHVHLPHV